MGMREFSWDGGLGFDISRPGEHRFRGKNVCTYLRLSFVSRVKVCTVVASLTYWNAPFPVQSASTHGPTFTHTDSPFAFSRFRKIAESDY